MRLPSGFFSFLLFILLFSLAQAAVFGDPDTAWHIAAGDLIRSLHSVPRHDPWSFTTPFETWYNLSWLFDVWLSLLFSLGHFTALYALTLYVFAFSIVCMAHHSVARGANHIMVAVVAVLTFSVIYVGVLARPNLASIVLSLGFYCLLHRYRRKHGTLALAVLPPLMALWANLHGGFLLAFVLIGFFFLEAALLRNRRDMKAHGLTLAACLAATLINPYGFAIYLGAYNCFGGFFRAYINEWQPVAIGHYPPMTALLALVLCVGNMRDTRVPLVDRMLSVALLLIALSSIRHTMVVSLLLMPYMSLRLTYFFEGTRIGARLKVADMALTRDMAQTSIRRGAAVLAAVAIFFVASPVPRESLLDDTPGFSETAFPDEEAEYIENHFPQLHFLNDYNIGGFLVYLWRGDIKVFVDGRADSVYSRDVLADYADFASAKGYGGNADRIRRQYGVEGLLVANNNKGADDWRWNPEWRAVHRGPVATVYLRADLAEKLLPRPVRKKRR